MNGCGTFPDRPSDAKPGINPWIVADNVLKGAALDAVHHGMTYTIEDIGDDPAIRADILHLNNDNARETSLLDAGKLARLLAAACVATVIVPGTAFLLAFDQGADYDSSNFAWFRERFDTFLYIDRVIVGQGHRRLGLGRLLYNDLFRRAELRGYRRIACEVNVRPPNPVSDAFHDRLGFTEVGRATSGDGAKSVRYLLRGQ